MLLDKDKLALKKIDIQSYDLDSVNHLNEIMKIKEKGFNSPHF